jgi:hypothetical protein
MFMLPTQFQHHIFKLSKHWQVAVRYFNCCREGKNYFVIVPNPIHIMCCVLWSNLAKLPTLAHSYTVAARPGPVSVAQSGYRTVHSIQHKSCQLHAQN